MFSLKMIDCFWSQKKRRVVRKCMLWIYLSWLHWLWMCHCLKNPSGSCVPDKLYCVAFCPFPFSCSLAFEITWQTHHHYPKGKCLLLKSPMIWHWKIWHPSQKCDPPSRVVTTTVATNTNCATTLEPVWGRSSCNQSMTQWVDFSPLLWIKNPSTKSQVTAVTHSLVSSIFADRQSVVLVKF